MELSHDQVDQVAVPARPLEMAAHRAVLIDEANQPASLSALWTELVGGGCKVEECVFNAQSCAVVVSRGHCNGAQALSKRHADILERSLIGGARKSLAVELGLCPSSVAEILKQGFTFMGLSCWPSRIPLLLVMAAHAKRIPELERAASSIMAENSRFSRQTISFSRPDSALSTRLSPAEYAVTSLLVEGKSYAEMAVLRQTSVRTVANQLASAFHRLGVSGRAELLCSLAKDRSESFRASLGRSRSVARLPRDEPSGFLRVAGGARG
jgi:DNA-binding CsgD family transcriptional regulator